MRNCLQCGNPEVPHRFKHRFEPASDSAASLQCETDTGEYTDLALDIVRHLLFENPSILAGIFNDLGYNSDLYLKLIEHLETSEGFNSEILDHYNVLPGRTT